MNLNMGWEYRPGIFGKFKGQIRRKCSKSRNISRVKQKRFFGTACHLRANSVLQSVPNEN